MAAGWARVADSGSVLGGPNDQVIIDIVEAGPGLVAVGRDGVDGELNAAVWTSPDGTEWTRLPYDEAVFGGTGSQAMFGVAVGGPGLVAVGYDASGGDADAAVWTSTDGREWTRVAHDEAVFGGADDQDMYSIVAGGPGFVAVGDDYSTGESNAAVWTSPDGVTWTRVSDAVLGSTGTQIMETVTVGGPGLVVVGYEHAGTDFNGAVWTSTDGASWVRVVDTDSALGGTNDQAILGVAGNESGLVAVGYDSSGGDWDTTVWTSPDGDTWTRVADNPAVFGGPGDQQVARVVAGGPGFVAGGRETSGNGMDAVVWTSVDGTEWVRVADPGSVFGGPRSQRIFNVAATSFGVIAVGFSEAPTGDWDGAIWILSPTS